jgi:Uma2 family endonuclease
MVTREKYMTAAEYLTSERKRSREEGKRELLFGKILEMAGASRSHNRISTNVVSFLYDLLEAKGLEVATSDLRVANPQVESYVYPDIVIFNHSEAQFLDEQLDTLLTPLAILEILSATTEANDRGEKFKMLRSIPSLHTYGLISSQEPLIEVFSKNTRGEWAFDFEQSMEKAILVKNLDIHFPLEKIYRKVSFRSPGQEIGKGEEK